MQDESEILKVLHKKQSVAGGWVSAYGIGPDAIAHLVSREMIETKKKSNGDTLVRMTAAGAKRLALGSAV